MSDYPSAPEDMSQWLPIHHIDHACDLLQQAELEGVLNREQVSGVSFYADPVHLATAHLAAAQAKMLSRGRA